VCPRAISLASSAVPLRSYSCENARQPTRVGKIYRALLLTNAPRSTRLLFVQAHRLNRRGSGRKKKKSRFSHRRRNNSQGDWGSHLSGELEERARPWCGPHPNLVAGGLHYTCACSVSSEPSGSLAAWHSGTPPRSRAEWKGTAT